MGDRPVIGIDQSARGTAAVLLSGSGRMVDKLFYADTKTAAKHLFKEGAVPPIAVKAGDETGRTYRLNDLRSRLGDFIGRWRPSHVAFEDYALARQAHSHTLGEVGGMLRLLCWRLQIPFRVYDVQAVKIFATGRGDAEKADMILNCRDKWAVDFLGFGKANGAAGNLTDAFTIARMLWTELEVRAGRVSLESLPEEERKVFLRSTKQKPVNVLGMDFHVV